MPAPAQHLDAVGRAIGEHEQVAAQGIGGQLGADQVGQPVESEPQIDGGREPQLGGVRDGQHGRPSNPRKIATINSGRVSAGNRTTGPDGSASSMGVAGAGGGVTRRGTTFGWFVAAVGG